MSKAAMDARHHIEHRPRLPKRRLAVIHIDLFEFGGPQQRER
jgi:hypothetical protein